MRDDGVKISIKLATSDDDAVAVGAYAAGPTRAS